MTVDAYDPEGPLVDADVPKDYRSGFVALTGRPNVGKSTLLNAYVGEKVAIVTRRPQTTRRRILGIKTTEGAQAIFVDTPGIHKPRNELGRAMVNAARSAIPDADVVVWVVDVSRMPSAMDRSIAGWIAQSERPVLLAMNKSDLLSPEDIEAHTDAYVELAEPDDWTLTIATDGHNLDRLWESIRERLPEGPPLYPGDQITDQTERAMVAELIREAALTYLGQEVPHGVEVLVDDWEEREDGLVGIAATLLVERESHKPIVIGKGGQMLKRIGSTARREVEAMLGSRVYLEIFVKVQPDWRSRSRDVRDLGFGH